MFEENFKNRKADFNKLVEYGFVLKNKQYIYQTDIMDDKFTLFVYVDSNGDVSTSMIEKDFNEEYTLYKVERASGSFVGSVRLAVDTILKDISAKCYKKSLYRYPQTELVIKYIKDKYNGELEFLWEKYLDYAVVRNKDNEKWYILIAPIPRNKLIKGTQGDV
ncbi:MAG: hypothetical protein K6F07_02765, partial [Bacilli bacterium]|nr:hypothetical protein [Bacilli bacterium]